MPDRPRKLTERPAPVADFDKYVALAQELKTGAAMRGQVLHPSNRHRASERICPGQPLGSEHAAPLTCALVRAILFFCLRRPSLRPLACHAYDDPLLTQRPRPAHRAQFQKTAPSAAKSR
jgi:hypothetical protein